MFEVLFELSDRLGLIHEHAILVMEQKGAVVEVDRPHHADCVVGEEALGVDESRRIFIDLHAALDERHIVGTGERKRDLLVGNEGRDDAHVHPSLGGEDERLAHAVVDDEVGRRDIDIFAGAADDVQIDVLAEVFIVEREGTVSVRLDVPLPFESLGRFDEIAGDILRRFDLHIEEA